MATKKINVTTTAYEGDVEFPEAQYYPEFVASELTRILGVPVECEEGGKTTVHVYGYEAREQAELARRLTPAGVDDAQYELACDVAAMVKAELWADFCDQGYKAYSARTTAA